MMTLRAKRRTPRWVALLFPVLAFGLVVAVQPNVLAACFPPSGGGGGGSGAGDLDGFWQSDGYGFLVEINGDEMLMSRTTAISCSQVVVANGSEDVPDGAEAAFIVDEEESEDVLDVDSGLMTISAGNSADVKRLRVDGAISDIVLNRVDAAPETCAEEEEDTPQNNFDIFWQTFEEHYPFFALHGLDWDAVREEFRPQVTDATTPAELHAIFVEMIEPLEDAHTFVELEAEDLEFEGERKDPQPLSDEEFDLIDVAVDKKLTEPRQSFADDELNFSRLANGIGYLEISGFSDFTESGRTDEALAELDRCLDVAFAKPMPGLVIDVRDNGGGSDIIGVAIASRLTKTAYTAYEKTARNDPADPTKFTAAQTITVEPSTDTIFEGPVAVLTSRYSFSAAETFPQALINRPGVTRIGENTQGVFSDVLLDTLPNGIAFGLPNEVYTTNGKSFDKVGVAPDISTGLVFRKANLKAGRDPEIDTAVKLLTAKSSVRPVPSAPPSVRPSVVPPAPPTVRPPVRPSATRPAPPVASPSVAVKRRW